MESIIDHKVTNEALLKLSETHVMIKGKQYQRKMTKGWLICVEWYDGSTSWEKLCSLKESYPVELAEYSVAQGINHQPVFCLWVPHVLCKQDCIIAVVNKCYHNQTHKFGFEVLKTVKHALEIGHENGNSLWQDAIALEMEAGCVAFKVMNEGGEPPPLVARGHMTKTPVVLTYMSVVSRDSAHIALTITLNNLQVKASDVQNAFLMAPCKEQIWTMLGPEFGADAGKKAFLVCALYGLKPPGGLFSPHPANCMRTLGYSSCKVDSDLRYKPVTCPDDGFEYYAYVLLYIDNCLAIHHDTESIMYELDKYIQMKKGSIADPDIYLGNKLQQVKLDNDVTCWSMSSSKYVQDAVNNVEDYLHMYMHGCMLPEKVYVPWFTDYCAELDMSLELDSKQANYYGVPITNWCSALYC